MVFFEADRSRHVQRKPPAQTASSEKITMNFDGPLASPANGDISPRATSPSISYGGLYQKVSEIPFDFYEKPAASPDFDSQKELPRPRPYYDDIVKLAADGAVTGQVETKRIYLCRHGETEPNVRRVLQGGGLNEGLNDTGKRQAACLSEYMSDAPLDLIVSSQLLRACETADIVASKHSAARQKFKDFSEISWGIWEGTRNPDISHVLEQWNDGNFDAKCPGETAESPLQCLQRAIPALYKLLETKHKHILIVAHGRLIRIMLAFLFQGDLTKMSSFQHHNACVNVLDAAIFKHGKVPSFLTPQDSTRNRLGGYPHVPDYIAWIPLVLDDFTHIPMELQLQ